MIHRFRLWLGQRILPGPIPQGRIIVPLGARFGADGVHFHNIQIDRQDGGEARIEGSYFDMGEMTALGLDFVTINQGTPWR